MSETPRELLRRVGRNAWRTCPRCGMEVYKPHFIDHDRKCLTVATAFGSPDGLAATFREFPDTTPARLARGLPGAGEDFIVAVLRARGVTAEEIAARTHAPAPVAHDAPCRRCTVLLDAPGARPSAADPGLCAWCADELAQRPSAALSPDSNTRAGRPRGWRKATAKTLAGDKTDVLR